jgi:S1-C subfamily serine protease
MLQWQQFPRRGGVRGLQRVDRAGNRWQVITAAAIALTGLATSASAQSDTAFTLVNRSSETITSAYVSPEKQKKWGRDILGSGVLRAGQQIKVEPPRNQGCIFDVRVNYGAERYEERYRQNLCTISEIVFNAANARTSQPQPGQKQPSASVPDFTVVNRATKAIQSIFVSSVEEKNWGADVLPGVLRPGDRFEVKLPRNGQCTYDVRIVYDDQAIEDRMKQNVCAVMEMAFSGPGQPQQRPPQGGGGAQGNGGISGYGTGFFVSATGHALTNNHVVDGCERIATVLEGQMVPSIIIRVDKQNDLALIRAQVKQNVPFAKFRASPGIRAGEDVVVAGFPFPQVLQNGLNITRGNVSALAGIGGNTAEMQMTAPVQPGNSGGPMFDSSGNVVGVVVARLNSQAVKAEAQNMNYAVQGAVARLFLESNGVRAVEAPSTSDMKIGDISDAARDLTFQIACFGRRR